MSTKVAAQQQEQIEDFGSDYAQLPVNQGEIGGNLISIVTKGLYTNPLDCIREYVQNGVDALASEVTIQITGNSVLVRDNGTGMGRNDLIQSRGLAISDKDPAEDVGFRGIGIYSGYDLSGQMIVTTKRAGDAFGYRMRVDFAEMRKNEEKPRATRASLFDLLARHTYFKKMEFAGQESLSFTSVELREVNDVHLRALSDRAAMRKYILLNLPVDFEDSFAFRNSINTELRAQVPGFKAAKVILRSDDAPDEVVAKPAIAGLQSPRFDSVVNSKGEKIGYYWACLSNDGAIGKDEDPNSQANPTRDYQGFVFKCKGFTVGDRHQLRRLFKTGNGALYQWYTGEIYVIDHNVRPNAARNDFEASAAKNQLEFAVRDAMKKLEGHASTFQKQTSAQKTVEEQQKRIEDVKARIEANSIDEFAAFAELEDIKDKLSKQKSKAATSLKKQIDADRKAIEALQKRLQAKAEQPGKRASTKAAATATSTGATASATTRTTNTAATGKPATRTLRGLLVDSGWCSNQECLDLAAAVDTALQDHFGSAAECEPVVLAISAALDLEDIN
jgi:hypothetical protein